MPLKKKKISKTKKKNALKQEHFEVILEEINSKFDFLVEMYQTHNAKFDRIDERFEQMDARFEQIDEKFKQIDERFEQIDERFKQIDERFEQMEKRFKQVDEKFESVFDYLSRIETEIMELRGELKNIKEQKADSEEMKIWMKEIEKRVVFLEKKLVKEKEKAKSRV